MTRSAVSVALCTFNGERYLREQLDSIARQTRGVDELLVGDDGSTDGTLAVVEQAGARLPVRLLDVSAQPLGAAANFGRTLRCAQSRLVFLCDQDDRWRDDKVDRLTAVFDAQPGVLMVASDARIIDADGVADGRRLGAALGLAAASRWSARDWMFALLKRNRVTGATSAVRRELLDLALPVPSGFWHDEWLALVAAACDGLAWVDDCLTDYRLHDQNAAGLRGSGIKATVAGAVAGGAAHHAAKAARLQRLVDRLRTLGDPVVADRLQQVEGAVAFWASRAALPRSAHRRAAIVAGTLRSGGYAAYGDGLKSALRDLLGA